VFSFQWLALIGCNRQDRSAPCFPIVAHPPRQAAIGSRLVGASREAHRFAGQAGALFLSLDLHV